ncbi:MGMT family protein [Patescibacteria group bacterium]|nr:MGMT family protein [Patescibacteria group bacterium]
MIKKKQTEFACRVYQTCAKVPKGKITTYKQIAQVLKTKGYQAVGQALRHNPYAPRVPCHRVVRSDGSLGGFGGKTTGPKLVEKKRLLEKERVKVRNNKIVDFEKKVYLF